MTTAWATERRQRGVFDVPSLSDAPPDTLSRDAEMPSPLSSGLCFAANGNECVRSGVVVLNDWQCPAAVIWSVMSVVVAAVKRVTRRTRTHVAVKGSEGRAPAFAHHDAASAVVGPLLMRSAVTAGLRLAPHGVFRRLAEAVPCVSDAKRFVGDAPAGRRGARAQVVSPNRSHRAAGASTHPVRPFAVGALGAMQRGPMAQDVSRSDGDVWQDFLSISQAWAVEAEAA
jgi:hypothetical protein